MNLNWRLWVSLIFALVGFLMAVYSIYQLYALSLVPSSAFPSTEQYVRTVIGNAGLIGTVAILFFLLAFFTYITTAVASPIVAVATAFWLIAVVALFWFGYWSPSKEIGPFALFVIPFIFLSLTVFVAAGVVSQYFQFKKMSELERKVWEYEGKGGTMMARKPETKVVVVGPAKMEPEMPSNKADVMEHISDHMQYPATKAQMVQACNNMEHSSKSDRDWFAKNLPDRTYKSADEVVKALKL